MNTLTESSKYLPLSLKNVIFSTTNKEASDTYKPLLENVFSIVFYNQLLSINNTDNIKIEKKDDIYFIHINKTLEKPLIINYIINNLCLNEGIDIKYKIIIKENCQADIIEHFSENHGDFYAKINSKYILENNSVINHYIINKNSENNKYIYDNLNNLSKNSTKNTFDINLSKGFSYINSTHELNDIHAQSNYYVLDYLENEAQNHKILNIIHNANNTCSTQLIKAAYNHKSVGNFFGGVIIDKSAKDCSALQSYKSILLSKDAKAFVRPQMQIHNNQIMAKHGATIGELDQEALFYLQSRNLSLHEAKSLLLHAVLQEVINKIAHKDIKNKVEELLGSCF